MKNKNIAIITGIILVIIAIIIGIFLVTHKSNKSDDVKEPIGTYTVTIILLSPALAAPMFSKKPSYF